MVLHRIQGYLLARVVHFLLNLHVQPRTVWMTRHGDSTFNVLGRIGGDAPLSESGRAYAQQLARIVRERMGPDLVVWTSTLMRAVDTAAASGLPFRSSRAPDAVDARVLE